jgi:hypothetical protein
MAGNIKQPPSSVSDWLGHGRGVKGGCRCGVSSRSGNWDTEIYEKGAETHREPRKELEDGFEIAAHVCFNEVTYVRFLLDEHPKC